MLYLGGPRSFRSVRSGMAVYVIGLILVTAAVELLIAYVIATRANDVAQSSTLWPTYFGAVIGLAVSGGVLIPRGLSALRSPRRPTEPGGGAAAP